MAKLVQHAAPQPTPPSPSAGQPVPLQTCPEPAVIASVQEGIWITNEALATTFVNSRMTALLGYRSDEMVGRSIADFADWTERAAVEAMLARLPAGITEQREITMRHRDGTPLFVVLDLRALFTAETEFKGVRASVIDVTARRVAEEQLQRQRARLIQAQTLARIGTWEWDLDSDTITCSEEMCRLLQTDPHMEALPFGDAMSALEVEHREEMTESFRAAAAGDEPVDYQVSLRTPQGERRVLRGRVQRECDFRGHPVRVVGMVQDITAQKDLEERLQQSERMSNQGQLAASVARELNNILMGIQPVAEMIVRNSTSDARVYESATRIADSVARGKRVTEEILRFTHTPAPARTPVDVAGWLADCYAEMVQLAGPRVAIAIDAESGMRVLADPQQLRQVFTNLVTNARDAMPRGGSIVIRAARQTIRKTNGLTALIHFTITDSGIGMSPETIRMAFEPLFTTKHTGGTGLGLAIAHKLVAVHEGELWADSVLGAGSTFHLLLPAVTGAPASVAPANKVAASEEPFHRILLVEDDAAVAMGLMTLLQLDQIEADLVTCGADVVARIESFSPEAVVLDVGLPDISGIAVYEQIARRWPSLPVLFSTGHDDERLLNHVLARPNVGYLSKPYESASLLRALGKLRG